ncbi:MAG: hypothetical protein KAR16_02115, partial [Bacteroidales bacterium]|nr:hypothetical protein [Bacteroidales bacterium]
MRRELMNFSVILVLLFLFPLSSFSQYSGSALAVISDVKGSVMLIQAQSDESHKVVFGMQLAQGDQVETGRKAGVTLLFSNGNLISLGANSSI